MSTGISLGQFLPGDSIIHRLDPRTKIILLFFFILGIFVFDTPASYALLSAFAIVLIQVSKVPFRMMLKSLKPLWWILLFTFLIHLCSTPGESFLHVIPPPSGCRGSWQRARTCR